MLLGRLSRDGSRNSQHMFYGSSLYVRVGRDGVVWLVEPRRIQGCARVGSFFLVFSEAHRLPLEWLFESRFDGQGDLAGCRGRIEANARDFFLAVVISDKAQRERPPALESSFLSSGEAETVSGREVSRRDRRHRGLDVEVN